MGLFSKLFGTISGSTARVEMLASVDTYVAGEKYDIPVETADTFIVRGYAKGNLSRDYTPEEIQQLSVNQQVVSI